MYVSTWYLVSSMFWEIYTCFLQHTYEAWLIYNFSDKNRVRFPPYVEIFEMCCVRFRGKSKIPSSSKFGFFIPIPILLINFSNNFSNYLSFIVLYFGKSTIDKTPLLFQKTVAKALSAVNFHMDFSGRNINSGNYCIDWILVTVMIPNLIVNNNIVFKEIRVKVM